MVMCLVLNPEVVLMNAFYASKGKTKDLNNIALRKFCNILHDDIIEDNTNYKYVYFDMDDDELDDYLELNRRFERGINRVYCIGDIEELEMQRVNSVYTQEIQSIIQKARESFANSLVEA